MRTVVGVLRGGPSSEYDISLKSGAAVLAALNQEKYEPRDLFVDRAGKWHLHGVEVTPERALRGVDVAFNAMHGEYGEDGEVQTLLNQLSVPFTGSDKDAAALAFDKARTKQAIKKLGIQTPRALVVKHEGNTEEQAVKIFRSFPHPAIVKPVIGGSSVGVTLVDNFSALAWALEQAYKVSPQVLVEEYIRGREATVGVIENFRNEKLYALMPTEIINPKESPFYDYNAKYVSNATRLLCPATFTQSTKQQLQDMARAVHEGLHLDHYSRSDFIVGKRGIYFLEVNTHPGLTEHSNMPLSLEAVGSKMSDFLDHVITLATKAKRNLNTYE